MGHWTLGKNRNRIGMAGQLWLTIRPVSIGPILFRCLTWYDHTLSLLLLSAIATFRLLLGNNLILETSTQEILAGRPNLLDDSRVVERE